MEPLTVRMTETRRGSPDGIRSELYRKGAIYTERTRLGIDLLRMFVRLGRAVLATEPAMEPRLAPAIPPAHKQMPAPENLRAEPVVAPNTVRTGGAAEAAGAGRVARRGRKKGRGK